MVNYTVKMELSYPNDLSRAIEQKIKKFRRFRRIEDGCFIFETGMHAYMTCTVDVPISVPI